MGGASACAKAKGADAPDAPTRLGAQRMIGGLGETRIGAPGGTLGALRTSALWALVALAAGLCSSPAAMADAPEPPRQIELLKVGPVSGPTGLRQIVDQHGRQVLLRGMNVDGLVDYYQPSLRPPYPSSQALYSHHRCPADDPAVEGVVLCWFDFWQMRPLGYDAIRLNLSWSLLEPAPGRIDPTYLDRVAQVVGWARAQGIYVILDMHQDAWSKYVYSGPQDICPPGTQRMPGYDGAPAWASPRLMPVCAAGGVRELDPAVQNDFQRFYSDAPAPDGTGLQEHYIDAMLALARRFAGDPAVAGYDIINEPSPGYTPAPEPFDTSVLLPFYAKVINGIVSRMPRFRQLFFIEPDVSRDVTDHSGIVTSWSSYSRYPNVVYAPHIYTRVHTPSVFPMDGGFKSAISDASHLGLPLWIGEFGDDPNDDNTILRAMYQLQDQYDLGGTMWLWKENHNDLNPSVYKGVYGPPFGRGVPQPSRIKFTSRAYPLFLAGRLQAFSYDPDSHVFELRATSARVRFGRSSQATVIFVPSACRWRARVSGARVQIYHRGSARELYVYPTGGRYGVYLAPQPAHRKRRRRSRRSSG